MLGTIYSYIIFFVVKKKGGIEEWNKENVVRVAFCRPVTFRGVVDSPTQKGDSISFPSVYTLIWSAHKRSIRHAAQEIKGPSHIKFTQWHACPTWQQMRLQLESWLPSKRINCPDCIDNHPPITYSVCIYPFNAIDLDHVLWWKKEANSHLHTKLIECLKRGNSHFGSGGGNFL